MIVVYTSLVVSLLLLWIYTYCRHYRSSTTTKLPPGPRPFPVIGNILELGHKPHQSLANLSKTYGPIMSLKLGSVTTIVVSTPNTAQLVLQKHDQTFSGRYIPDAIRACDHHLVSVAWVPVSQHFRNLKKLSNSQLFTVQRLEAGQDLRRKKVQELLHYVQESCVKGESVDIGGIAFTTSLNLLSNTFFSIDLANYNSNSSKNFKNLVWSMMEEVGRPNIVDFFPLLGMIDPQGVRRRLTKYFGQMLSVFESIINQRSEISRSQDIDVLDTMLRITNEDGSELSYTHLQHLLLDLFAAGTDSTSSTVEWAMAELIHNPTSMLKAQAELREVLDKSKPIQESDIYNLPYLQAVVKEIFRLHPPVPLLLPRSSGCDIEIDGFFVPRNSKVLVNVWAIGRDPTTWSDPERFIPERFLDQKIDVKGHDFELTPFGSGRRICPGLPLAQRMIHLMLASLLRHFDWNLEYAMKPEYLDMSEKFGLTLQKNKPLRAVPIKV